jgi:hypothetical protein
VGAAVEKIGAGTQTSCAFESVARIEQLLAARALQADRRSGGDRSGALQLGVGRTGGALCGLTILIVFTDLAR